MKFYALLFWAGLLAGSLSAQAQNCTVNAGTNATVCQNSTLTLNGNASGQFQNSGLTTWSQVSGAPVTLSAPHSLSSGVTGITAGTYEFKLSATCQDGSTVSNNVTYTVAPITSAAAGPDVTLCPGTASLSGSNPGAGTGTWSIVVAANEAGVTIQNPNSPTSAITLSAHAQGSSVLRWTVRQGSCTATDEVVITNRGGLSPVSAGPDQTLSSCYSGTTTATLAGSKAGLGGTSGQEGTWALVSGPNTPVITALHSPTSTVTGLIQGVYILRWTVDGPCVTGMDEVQITVPANTSALTSAGSNSSVNYCDGRTSAVLSAPRAQFAGEAAQWTQVSGPAGAVIAAPSSYNTTVSGLDGSGTYVFRYTITNASGCSSSVTRTIGFSAPPTISITSPSPLMGTCGSSFIPVSYAATGGVRTEFKILSAPTPGFVPNSYFSAATASPYYMTGLTTPGTYVVRFQQVGGTGCATATADVTILVSGTPSPANAGTDQLLGCSITATSLAGNLPTSGTGTWSQVSGPGTAVIADPAHHNSGVSGLVPGAYVFKWSISNGVACAQAESLVKVSVASGLPTTATAGEDAAICYGITYKLSGNTPAANETGTWSVHPSAGVSFSDTHAPRPTVTGLAANTVYTFTWQIANACGSTSDNVVLTTGNVQGPAAANAGADICRITGTPSFVLGATAPAPAGATGIWQQVSGPSSAHLSDAASATPTVTGLANGTYVFEWVTSLNGCTPSRDTVLATVSPGTTISVTPASQDICTSSATLTGNGPASLTGLWSQVGGNGGAVIASPGLNSTTVSGLVPGAYTFRWSVTNGGCGTQTSDAVVRVGTPPSAASAGADQSCLSGSSTSLNAAAPAAGSGAWSQVGGPSQVSITNPLTPATTVTGLGAGTYTFRWTVTNGLGCTPSTDDLVVAVNPPADAGTDLFICNSPTVSLTGNAGSTGTWTQVGTTPATASFAAVTANAAAATNLVPGTYTFRYTLSSQGVACPGSFDDRQVTIRPPATPAVAGADKSLCNVSSFTLAANGPGANEYSSWSLVSGPNTPVFAADPATPNNQLSGAVTGTYTYRWTITGTGGGGCSSSSDIKVAIAPLPSAANAGPNQAICQPTATLAGNAPAAGSGQWVQVAGPATTIANPLLPTTQVSGLIGNTTYAYQWQIRSGSCPASVSGVQVAVTCSNLVLPVTLVRFSAIKEGTSAFLNWETANEEQFSHYVVERSQDGVSYAPMATVAAQGGTANTYAYTDKGLPAGSLYYRLRMVEADGRSSFSKVIRLSATGGSPLAITVSPNPAKTTIALAVENDREGRATISLLDATGKQVWVERRNVPAGSSSLRIGHPAHLGRGLYLVKVEMNQSVITTKCVFEP
ncbi:T9SS type A sorting domain-containing protein [Paraflavisolibacter sp. H34]|uniref:PKD domain-containing protein n=1 Tax=Huijunlia imazamoxiresistens TaxID=3127457 RepID=UPI0030195508